MSDTIHQCQHLTALSKTQMTNIGTLTATSTLNSININTNDNNIIDSNSYNNIKQHQPKWQYQEQHQQKHQQH